LVAALEESGCFGGEVVLYALWAGAVGLVNVDALDGAAEGAGKLFFGGKTGVLGLTADGVVEDEDFGSAGAGMCK
jgi:hypothetical protein